MKDIDLYDINKQLMETTESLGEKLAKLMPVEMEYQSRLDELQLQSQQANQFQREAEARKVIILEPIYLKYQELKLEVKILYIKFDCLKTVSKNIQSYAYNEK